MTTSSISTLSINNSLRRAVADAQKQLTDAQTEVTTGKYADIGVTLGGKVGQSLDLSNEVSRIDNLISTNSIVTQRLDSSQTALSEMANQAQKLNQALLALSSNVDASSLKVTQQSVTDALQAFTGAANTSVNGEFLFAGVNTDVKPLTDYTAAGNPAKASFDSALSGFLASQVPPLANASQMSPAQMTDFIDNTLTPMFTGNQWKTDWSQATDQNMQTRINTNETIDSSTNANSLGMRKFALASVITTEFLTTNISTELRQVVSQKAIAITGQAISGIDAQRSQLGLSQARVTDATDNLNTQKTIIQTHLSNLQEVDAYAASTRVQNLKTMVETAYSLTANLQRLSLLNYL